MRLPIFMLFMLMVVFSPLAIDLFLPAIPIMAISLDASLGSIQAIVALFILCMGLGQLLAGPLADRYGRKPLMMAGVAIYIMASLGCAWSVNVTMLWLMRAMQGLGTCAIVVAAYSGVRDRYQGAKLGAIYSYLNGVICVVPALAPMLGGVLTEQFHWQANFYFMALFGLVAGFILVWQLPETQPAEAHRPVNLISWQQYQPIVSHPLFLFYGVMVTLAFTAILGYVSFSTDVLMVQLAQSPMAFSMWFGSNAALNIALAFVAPSVIRRIGKQRGLYLAISLCCVAGGLMLLLQHWAHPLAFMGPVYLSGICCCMLFAVCTGSAMEPFGERAGTASALLGTLQMTGAAVLVGAISCFGLATQTMLAILMALPLLWWLAFRMHRNYAMVAECLDGTLKKDEPTAK
ncbi:MAG: multidrug effflux MFS transporter [Ferrimonas sp.]